ncbi:MAG: zf-HC2 domain-containing protein [Acidobacteriota bacterium]|nr:zf-HC2 domain-containing protein [Acidobacteriota bacterium]
MICDKVQNLLSPYLDGELAPRERAEVDAHLAACPECAGLAARMRAAVAAFAAFPDVDPSPALRRRLLAIPERSRRFRLDLDFLRRPVLQPFLAVAAGLLMLVSVYFASPGSFQRSINREFHRGIGSIEKIYVRAGSLTDRIGDLAVTAYDSAKAVNPIGRAENRY